MKKWYLSKTIWANLLTLSVGLLGYLIGHDIVQEYPSIVSIFVAAQGFLNIVLRLITKEAVK